MHEGNCVLCGKFGQLSFEHVPPRVAFNKTTQYRIVEYLDLLQNANPLEPIIKGKVKQGGVGYYSLCRSCNSFLGSNYVTAYTSYSNSFIEFAKRDYNNHCVFDMHDFEALKVIKQVVSMFLTINSWEFSKNNPELSEFVLDPTKQELPPKFRFFEYLNTEGQLRNLALSVKGSFATKLSVAGSEIAFPPLGHVMTVGFTGNLPFHQEITDFKLNAINEKITYRFHMYRLPTILPMFLDYRTKESIANTINSNQ